MIKVFDNCDYFINFLVGQNFNWTKFTLLSCIFTCLYGPDSDTFTTFVALGPLEITCFYRPYWWQKKCLPTFILKNTSKVACFLLNNAAQRNPFLMDPRHVPMGDAALSLDTCFTYGGQYMA